LRTPSLVSFCSTSRIETPRPAMRQQVGRLRDQHRGQTFRRLVDHDQVGIAQRAADRQHLLLAA